MTISNLALSFLLSLSVFFNSATLPDMDIYKTNTFKLGEKKYEIEIPHDWIVKRDNSTYSKFEVLLIEDHELEGMIGTRNGLPNHSEIIEQWDIDTKIGKGKAYVLKRDTPAAEEKYKKWYELTALIGKDDNKTGQFYMYIISEEEDDIKEDLIIFEKMLKSLKPID